jgi:hypothetical protein
MVTTFSLGRHVCPHHTVDLFSPGFVQQIVPYLILLMEQQRVNGMPISYMSELLPFSKGRMQKIEKKRTKRT